MDLQSECGGHPSADALEDTDPLQGHLFREQIQLMASLKNGPRLLGVESKKFSRNKPWLGFACNMRKVNNLDSVERISFVSETSALEPT